MTIVECPHLVGFPVKSKCGKPGIPMKALWGIGGIPLHPDLLPTMASLAPPVLLSMTLKNGGQINCRAALSPKEQVQCSGYPVFQDGDGE